VGGVLKCRYDSDDFSPSFSVGSFPLHLLQLLCQVLMIVEKFPANISVSKQTGSEVPPNRGRAFSYGIPRLSHWRRPRCRRRLLGRPSLWAFGPPVENQTRSIDCDGQKGLQSVLVRAQKTVQEGIEFSRKEGRKLPEARSG